MTSCMGTPFAPTYKSASEELDAYINKHEGIRSYGLNVEELLTSRPPSGAVSINQQPSSISWDQDAINSMLDSSAVILKVSEDPLPDLTLPKLRDRLSTESVDTDILCGVKPPGLTFDLSNLLRSPTLQSTTSTLSNSLSTANTNGLITERIVPLAGFSKTHSTPMKYADNRVAPLEPFEVSGGRAKVKTVDASLLSSIHPAPSSTSTDFDDPLCRNLVSKVKSKPPHMPSSYQRSTRLSSDNTHTHSLKPQQKRVSRAGNPARALINAVPSTPAAAVSVGPPSVGLSRDCSPLRDACFRYDSTGAVSGALSDTARRAFVQGLIRDVNDSASSVPSYAPSLRRSRSRSLERPLPRLSFDLNSVNKKASVYASDDTLQSNRFKDEFCDGKTLLNTSSSTLTGNDFYSKFAGLKNKPKTNIIDDFIKDCISTTQESTAAGVEIEQQPMETLKNMLFTMQDVASTDTSLLVSDASRLPAVRPAPTDVNSGNDLDRAGAKVDSCYEHLLDTSSDAKQTDTESLGRAMEHLNRLRSLVNK